MQRFLSGPLRLKIGDGSRSGLLMALALIAVVMLAAHLRLQASYKTTVDAPLRADAGDYFAYAYNLVKFGVYSRSKPDGQSVPKPDAVRSPGYPLFVAAMMDDPPSNTTLQKIMLAQALMGIGAILLVFALARRIVPAGYAVLAALLAAISPHLVNTGVFILSEALFTFCVLVLMCVLVHPGFRDKPMAMLVAGLVLGVCTLVRPTLLYFPLVLIGLLFIQWPGKLARRAAILLLLGMAISYGPWTARNMMQLGVPSDPALQINMLHHGLYPNFMYQDEVASRGFPYRFDPRSDEIAQSVGSVTHEILARFKEEPARYLHWYLLGKPYYLWSWTDMQSAPIGSFTYPATHSPYYDSGLFMGTYLLARLLHWPLIICAFIFCVLIWLPSTARLLGANAVFPARLCAALLLYLTALHMAGAPFSRYSIPFLPELYVMAAGALFLFIKMMRKRKRKHESKTPEAASA